MRPIDADALIEKCGDWYVEEGTESGFIGTLKNLLATEPTIQPVATDTNVGDTISKFIDGLEEIFADLRERHVDDSVCGLCEYDGAYMGQSGDWCNECPGFDRDDCFKLSDKTRKEWTEEIIKALPTVQPEKAQLSQEGTTSDLISRQAVKYLDLFTKTYCRDESAIDDLSFRCSDCEFELRPSGKCLVKCMARKLCPDYKDFGSMGDL